MDANFKMPSCGCTRQNPSTLRHIPSTIHSMKDCLYLGLYLQCLPVSWPCTGHYSDFFFKQLPFRYSILTTSDSGIFIIAATVVNSPSAVTACLQARLWSGTIHIVHPDWARTSSKPAIFHWDSSNQTETAADDSRVILIPLIFTHGTPLTVMVDLNTTFVKTVSVHQTHISLCGTQGNQRYRKKVTYNILQYEYNYYLGNHQSKFHDEQSPISAAGCYMSLWSFF